MCVCGCHFKRPEHVFLCCAHPVLRQCRRDWADEIQSELDKHIHPGARAIVDRLWKIDDGGTIAGAAAAEESDFKDEWVDDMPFQFDAASDAEHDDTQSRASSLEGDTPVGLYQR